MRKAAVEALGKLPLPFLAQVAATALVPRCTDETEPLVRRTALATLAQLEDASLVVHANVFLRCIDDADSMARLAAVGSYVHAYMHTCMHACEHACMRTCMRACEHVCMRTCMPAHVHGLAVPSSWLRLHSEPNPRLRPTSPPPTLTSTQPSPLDRL